MSHSACGRKERATVALEREEPLRSRLCKGAVAEQWEQLQSIHGVVSKQLSLGLFPALSSLPEVSAHGLAFLAGKSFCTHCLFSSLGMRKGRREVSGKKTHMYLSGKDHFGLKLQFTLPVPERNGVSLSARTEK